MPVDADSSRSHLSDSSPAETLEPKRGPAETAETEQSEVDPEQLLVTLLPLVRRMAVKMRGRLPTHIQVDDLVGAGALGLVDAIRKFDPRKRVKLEKYAKLRIRGAMLDGLRDLDVASRDLRKKSKRVEKVYRELERELGRPVTDEEMAKALHMSLTDWYRTMYELQVLGVDWLRPTVVRVTKRGREENLAAENQESQFDLCYSREKKEILDRAINSLSRRDRIIIAMYYDEGLTMKQIAAKLGIDESRISQLHSAALVRLRSLVGARTNGRQR